MTKSKSEGGMGFRDLALHNESLLAKQAWRLLQDQSSLFYKVFKPCFFPNCTIMEAEESSHGSNAWRSILYGRDVIKCGACWRIGSGQKVQIWQHTWLPSKPTTHVLSPILEGWEKTTVDALINEENWTWNNDVLAGLFVPEEAELITRIPLSKHPIEDKLYWPWTQNGQYTCKSGYRFLKEEEEVVRPEVAQNGDRNLWRSIWSLRVPNRVKNFLWHACHDAIPTKANLMRRHILVDPMCERCWKEEETPLHALWSCSELSTVWSLSQWSSRKISGVTNFRELLSWILNNQGNSELFGMTTWGIWSQRNQVHNHQPCYTSDQIVPQAKERLNEFFAVLPPVPAKAPKPQVVWKPPDRMLVKINFDGAIFKTENRSRTGVVIRDHTGAILASQAQSFSPALTPVEIEVVAAARALEFGLETGSVEAILEGDSELIMNSLKAGGDTIALVQPLVQDAIIFSNFYTKLLYSHCRRDNNKLAHSLARYSANVSDYVVWMEEVPLSLFSVAQNDLITLTNHFQ